jgi:hypothetical protein
MHELLCPLLLGNSRGMSLIVYFSHSYRAEDSHVVDYFGRLMRSEDLVVSLDPPSKTVNSAKLEKHLGTTDGMVAVLTCRKGGVSQHILYEISLCLKSKRPIIVFIEDKLDEGIIPPRILQRRFSRQSLLRQTREHRHALGISKSYMGENPPPKYQPSLGQRSCLLIGMTHLPDSAVNEMKETISNRGYSLVELDEHKPPPIYEASYYEKISCADIALCLIDANFPSTRYAIGAVHVSLLPTITLTTQRGYQYHQGVPQEYQPKIIDPNNDGLLSETIAEQLGIFEEDFLDLDDHEQVDKYSQLLLELGSRKGEYTTQIRNIFAEEVVMGHKITTGDNAIVGIDSRLNKVTMTIGSSERLTDEQREDLGKRVDSLNKLLIGIKDSHAQEVSLVISRLEELMKQIDKPVSERKKSILDISASGLLEAAKSVSDVVPGLIETARKIAEFVGTLA